MDHMMDTDTIISLRKCSGCHTTKVINQFGINNKGLNFKTCDNCRLRNKTKSTKQIKHYATFNEQIKHDSTYETMILTDKSKTTCFKTVL
jgi:predicted metal-binding protein